MVSGVKESEGGVMTAVNDIESESMLCVTKAMWKLLHKGNPRGIVVISPVSEDETDNTIEIQKKLLRQGSLFIHGFSMN